MYYRTKNNNPTLEWQEPPEEGSQELKNVKKKYNETWAQEL